MSTSPHCILLVEDDENDVFIMKRALFKANLEVPMYLARDGKEAVDYLSGAGKFHDRAAHPLPQCMFLDLKIPYVHGFEVLEWMRKQPTLNHISVFVLSSSPEDRDRQRALQLGAKAYLVKPPTPEMLREMLRSAPEGPCGESP